MTASGAVHSSAHRGRIVRSVGIQVMEPMLTFSAFLPTSEKRLGMFSLRSRETFLVPLPASEARPLMAPEALSAAAPGLGRLLEPGLRFLPTSLAAPLACMHQVLMRFSAAMVQSFR